MTNVASNLETIGKLNPFIFITFFSRGIYISSS